MPSQHRRSPPWRPDILDKAIIMLEMLNLVYKLTITYLDELLLQRLLHPPSPQSETINVLHGIQIISFA